MEHFPDTPSHIGFIKKKANEPRRDKRHCVYYEDNICHYSYGYRCAGSAQCMHYVPTEVKKEKTEKLTRKQNKQVPRPTFYVDNLRTKRKKRPDKSHLYNGISVGQKIRLFNITTKNEITIQLVSSKKKSCLSSGIVAENTQLGNLLKGRHIGDILTVNFKGKDSFQLKIVDYKNS